MSDLIRGPGRWRGAAPDGELVMQVVGPPLASGRPGWPTVTGWREIPAEPGRMWVQVQVAVDPDDREPETVAPASSYKPDDPVFVWRGAWHRGHVVQAGGSAVLARYIAPGIPGWAVDQATEVCMMARNGGNGSPPRRTAATTPRPVMQHLLGAEIELNHEATAALEPDDSVPITVTAVRAGRDPDYVELYGLTCGLAGNTEWVHYEVRTSRLPPPADVGPG